MAVLWLNTLNAYGCGSTLGANGSPARYARVDSRSSSIAAAPAPDAAWYVETISLWIRLRVWIGQSGVIEMIVEQLGFAMMPLCCSIVWALISGTTSGTDSSMRNADELSTTTAPCRTAIGPNFFEMPLPAE